ncbi:hypothetical protein BDV93DRAFT_549575 [Ceratobasidium sp. AG-I]|nr:hypothetical protein BDV93DRAFT_549575 [Ceratobasidium sp. AG-I]
MSWHRTLLGVIAWIVILAPILPVSPMANLAGPLPSPLSPLRSYSTLNLSSTRPPSATSTKESASCLAPIKHSVSHVLHGTKPPTLWSRAGGRTRQALWRARLKVVTPVLDKIVRPSTTGTGKADVAPTSTWTIINPAPARAAPGYARGRSYADGFKSCPTSSAFPSVFDVGKDVWNWIVSAGAATRFVLF